MKYKIPEIIIKHKKILTPLLFIVLGIFVLLFIIIPQFSTISDLNNQVAAENDKVNTLKNSLQVVSSQDDQDLNAKVGIATDALPTAKDVSRIFSALSQASDASQTVLGEFSLNVGAIYGRAQQLEGKIQGTPSITVNVRVEGNGARELSDFAKDLQKALPLSEIRQMGISDNSASYQINFFYKPVDLSVISKQDKVVLPNQNAVNLLNELKTWESQ